MSLKARSPATGLLAPSPLSKPTMLRVTGRLLNEQSSVGAQHALYREDGTQYRTLTRFPGALFDANGYVLFDDERAYKGCAGLIAGKGRNRANVPREISTLPGYIRKR